MAENNHRKWKQQDGTQMLFTVAECGEFHSMGEYHEGIKTLAEAAAVYRMILHKRGNGVPSIGIRIHRKGAAAEEDVQLDILSGSEIDRGILRQLPEGCSRVQVQRVIKELAWMFPEKELVDF